MRFKDSKEYPVFLWARHMWSEFKEDIHVPWKKWSDDDTYEVFK